MIFITEFLVVTQTATIVQDKTAVADISEGIRISGLAAEIIHCASHRALRGDIVAILPRCEISHKR